MASLNYNDYRSAGIYFIEQDNSVIESVDAESLRLAVGFSKTGPFNVPVFLNSVADAEKYFGKTDTKLERKGSFFQRSLNTLVKQSPVFALNLLPVDSTDKSEMAQLSVQANRKNEDPMAKPYRDYFDRTRFWHVSADKVLAQSLNGSSYDKGNILNIANTSTNDFTVFVRKAENVRGYNITARDFYGSEDSIPYSWINPSDYLCDYFLQVFVVKGLWKDYATLSKDPYWSTYFNADGLKKNMVNKFLNLEAITVLGNWTGIIIPNFYAKNGDYESLIPQINQTSEQTGFVASLNEELLEELESTNPAAEEWGVDLVGHSLSSGSTFTGFLSYPAKEGVIGTTLKVSAIEGPSFYIDSSTVEQATINDLIEGENSKLVRVIKKQYTTDPSGKTSFKYTCSGNVKTAEAGETKEGTTELSVVKHTPITEMYDSLAGICLKGLELSNKHMPGFDETGVADLEAGIEKIYKMLTDDGIKRGLCNEDLISFRYIIDTMGGGKAAGLGGKKYLSMLAKEVGSCTAIISYPSISYLADSTQPIFYDTANGQSYGDFDSAFIPTGGNPDAIGAGTVSIPGEDEGAKYCGVFAPYLKYTEGSKTILVPPAADVANAYMRKFITAGDPYVTVANTNGILSNSAISGVEYQFDKTDRDNIEPYGINPIIYRNGNVMIYGDKTAYQDVISDYNYLHVREILNTIEIEVRAILHPYIFKYNNAETRAEIVRKVTPILQSMQDAGALYSFEIQMDENNNTAEVIERSYGILDIGVQMGKNLEKIVTRIKVNRLATE